MNDQPTMNDHQTAGEALQKYYESHYFGDRAFRDPIVLAKIGPLSVPTPNPKWRREIIHLHDLHHLLTRYDTSWSGEGEVAAWELATGFPQGYRIAYCYAPVTFIIGFFFSPRRVVRALRRGWGAKNLCHLNLKKDELMQMSLEQLRQKLNLSKP
jgi:hypothetical protein